MPKISGSISSEPNEYVNLPFILKAKKMEGSDFSYEDTGTSDAFIKDFSNKKLGSEKKKDTIVTK
ncbi:MAG TPA: hypothetical protein DEG96_07085 [Candidatus Atribacteria bacterium]|nr:hypothetical protein [Candidatus Atribacteria bacterium]